MYTSLERNGTSGHPIDSLQGTMLISLAPVLYCGQNPVEQHKKNVYQSSNVNNVFKHLVFCRNITLETPYPTPTPTPRSQKKLQYSLQCTM